MNSHFTDFLLYLHTFEGQLLFLRVLATIACILGLFLAIELVRIQRQQQYIAPQDNYCKIPLATTRMVTSYDGTVHEMVYVMGKPVARLEVKSFDIEVTPRVKPDWDKTRVFPEMASSGATAPVVAHDNNSRYCVVFLDKQHRNIGSGFRLTLEGQNYLVTAAHVAERCAFVRSPRSEYVCPMPKVTHSFNDVAFLKVSEVEATRLGVRARRTPVAARNGPMKMVLLRSKVLIAHGAIEGRWEEKHPLWEFGLIHRTVTEPGDSGTCVMTDRDTPVAVHVGADANRQRNVAIALEPIVRLVLGVQLPEGDDESDIPVPRGVMYETVRDDNVTLYPYASFDDFVAVSGRQRRVAKTSYAIDNQGTYTYVPKGRAWADYEDTESLPSFGGENYFEESNTVFRSTLAPRQALKTKPWVLESSGKNRMEPQTVLSKLEPRQTSISEGKSQSETSSPKDLSMIFQKLDNLCTHLAQRQELFTQPLVTQSAGPQQSAPKERPGQLESGTSEGGSSNKNSRRRLKRA